MNIFEVLQGGHSRIHEVTLTAFLGYFINIYGSHFMGDVFLRELMSVIDNNDNYDNSETNIEAPISGNKSLDIQIKLFKDKEEIRRFIIENKIKDQAATKQQLKDYYLLQRDEVGNIPITVLFITHENHSDSIKEEYDQLSEGDMRDSDSKHHIYWSVSDNDNDNDNDTKTIHKILLNIIEKEYKAEIDPIHNYVLQTIKSFARYLESLVARPSYKTNIENIEEDLKRQGYNIVDLQESLMQQLITKMELNFSDLEYRTDKRFTRFYYNIENKNFKICVQSSNAKDPTIRIKLMPKSNYKEQKKELVQFCINQGVDGAGENILKSKAYGGYAVFNKRKVSFLKSELEIDEAINLINDYKGLF
jgi:RNA polymerase-binding transcription factor DksA